jgi:hypothetical protein
MLDDGRLERGHGIRTDLLSDGGLSFNIGNLYLEPIIKEGCAIIRFLKSILKILPAQTCDHSIEARNSKFKYPTSSLDAQICRWKISGISIDLWDYVSIMNSRFNDHSRKKAQSHKRESIEPSFPFFDNSVRLCLLVSKTSR